MTSHAVEFVKSICYEEGLFSWKLFYHCMFVPESESLPLSVLYPAAVKQVSSEPIEAMDTD